MCTICMGNSSRKPTATASYTTGTSSQITDFKTKEKDKHKTWLTSGSDNLVEFREIKLYFIS